MTVVFERPVGGGPATRALVLGVGAYPLAQDPNHRIKELRAVEENVSSATSAVLFTDWLIRNADRIDPPVASIDLLLCAVLPAEPGAPRREDSSYVWRGRVAAPDGAIDPRPDARVDPPTSAALQTAGATWLARLRAERGSHAVFYGCGHGANLPGKAMLLLQDLNANPGDPWAAHFDVSHHALAFDQIDEIDRATFFLDACAEQLDGLRKNPPGNGVRLENYLVEVERVQKVYALSAAAAPSLTFEGDVPGSPGVKAGRFTQCLLKALDGAAIRLMDGVARWGVPPGELKQTIAMLSRLRDDWKNEGPIRPKVIEDPAERWSIVTPAAPIMIPFCVDVTPESDTPDWSLSVFDREAPDAGTCLHHRPAGAFARWVIQLPVATQRYALVAQRAAPVENCIQLSFLPALAIFDLRVPP